MISLYSRSQQDIILREAISTCKDCFQTAVGLFYSPETCFLAKVSGEEVTDSQGVQIHLDRVFEARVFNEHYELRWLNKMAGSGTAVLLSEQKISDYLAEDVPKLEAVDTQKQTYLLWGEGLAREGLAPGWSRLATSRLGKLDVPIAGVTQSKQRVQLQVKEYFRQMDELYGNVIVAEERLIKLLKSRH